MRTKLLYFIFFGLIYWLSSEFTILDEIGLGRSYLNSFVFATINMLFFIAMSTIFLIIFNEKSSEPNKRLLLITFLLAQVMSCLNFSQNYYYLSSELENIYRGPVNIFDSADYPDLIAKGELPLAKLNEVSIGIAQQNYIWQGTKDPFINEYGELVKYQPTDIDLKSHLDHQNNVNILEIETIKNITKALISLFFVFFTIIGFRKYIQEQCRKDES
jgi:hypothetical protein